ncbi:MAG: VOC family protein [Rhodocyclaceae bacterium]|nr:VOC family protein [Rhodocyclaceae bacterium]
MKTTTYLSFPGNCEAALKFYETAIGAQIKHLSLYRGSPMELDVPPEMRDKVLHGVLDIGGDTLMAADSMGEAVPMSGFAITLNSDTPAEAERLFAALAAGGAITMPLQETFWARRFGMLVDRYGVPWMVNCEKPM